MSTMSANMEKCSKKELLAIVSEQNEKINRYETRLRDVVIAYKGLVKEKEALELSVKALSTPKSSTPSESQDVTDEQQSETTEASSQEESEILNERVNKTDDEQSDEMIKKLHQQLTTLTNSLATLSAEKSRMEASFQADKKQLRLDKEEREKNIRELQEKNQLTLNEVENLKAKLVVERHERDKERNDHGVMIRELQKLLSDERRRVEQLEAQSEELRSKLLQMEQQSGHNEKKLRDVKNELEATRRKLKRAEAEVKNKEAPPLLLELQDEMANLKQQHHSAILQEQKRVVEAEERARNLAALHEERVANLEARLAELSETVGTYDRLRQHDQAAIVKLKEHIAQLDLENSASYNAAPKSTSLNYNENEKNDIGMDVQSLVEQISNLKSELLMASEHNAKYIDVQEKEDIHKECTEEIRRLQGELEWLKNQQQTRNDDDDTSSLVNALKERIQLLNAQMNDREENKRIIDNLQKMLKAEKARSKSELTALETDYRCRLSLLEQQLQKQRERSLMLLEDKEQEIRLLKSSFGMFLPSSNANLNTSPDQLQDTSRSSDDGTKHVTHFGVNKNAGNSGESPHMLHYAHEIARRDVEISNLRRSNHRLESSLRESNRRLTSEEEFHREEMNELREEVARLERCQSREGANLEYLKNVVLSFLTSSDTNCKRHMLNAIAAVLKFSIAELERVNKIHKTPVQPVMR